ncbi:MAG TPA: xanthine dehydrogenase family protein molybdopterin-binding subunit, partial [Lachnospiraceae bacterium]|nr:xanthine dehydrogenase family protein molybdopterin-binding subunit [Lachnospiraceae bacterium]
MFQTPKDPKDYKYVGKSTPRKDAVDIVTGKAVFLDDFNVADQLIGKSLKSPYSHAMIKSIHTEKAKALPGIKAVLTYEDCNQDWKMGWPPQKPILDRHLRYIGDSVALVAGETEEICNEALDLIEVEYDVLPAVYDGLSALEEDAPQLYDEFKNNIVTPGYPPFQQD